MVKFQIPNFNTFWDMNYFLLLLVKSRQQMTDRQTDRKLCIWAHRAICTGGLKNAIWHWKWALSVTAIIPYSCPDTKIFKSVVSIAHKKINWLNRHSKIQLTTASEKKNHNITKSLAFFKLIQIGAYEPTVQLAQVG